MQRKTIVIMCCQSAVCKRSGTGRVLHKKWPQKKGLQPPLEPSQILHQQALNGLVLCPSQTAQAAARMCALVVEMEVSIPVYPQIRSMGCWL